MRSNRDTWAAAWDAFLCLFWVAVVCGLLIGLAYVLKHGSVPALPDLFPEVPQ